jgi:hypothetical protein
MQSKITNLEVARKVKDVFALELTRLQAIARHGNKDAARQIIVTLAHQNLALKALGYRLNWEDSDDHELYPLTTADPVVR